MIPWAVVFVSLIKLVSHWAIILRRRRINELQKKENTH